MLSKDYKVYRGEVKAALYCCSSEIATIINDH